MYVPLSDALTAQFYEWEKRGRGWHIFENPVDLEPDFYPFFGHYVPPKTFIDDSKRNTLFSKIGDFFNGSANTSKDTGEIIVDEIPVTGFNIQNDSPIHTFRISLPKGAKIDANESLQLLLMLSYTKCPISFEIIGREKDICIQFACREPDADHLYTQLKAYFPEVFIQETEDLIEKLVDDETYFFLGDFGLRDEFMRPLATYDSIRIDPFIGLFAAFEKLKKGECGIIQVLFKGAINPWAESILRSVSDNEGKSFFEDAPDMLPLAKEKVSAPLYGVTIRVACGSLTKERSSAIIENLSNTLIHLYSSPGNTLIPLSGEYTFGKRVYDLCERESHRLGMLLNCNELATLVHLPSETVLTEKLTRDTKKTNAAPEISQGNEFKLGTNFHQGVESEVTLSSAQRLKHTHIIGATGTGKSTFLENLIVQDILQGKGIAVLDPHGDLIENILAYIPEHRYEDCIVIDPSDGEYPVGFNILEAHSEIEKDILSSDLVSVFRRLSTSWGDQMNSVLANAILAFLESGQGGTLADLRRFLVEKSFRDTFLRTVSDPNITYYWQKEYPLLRTNSIGSILTRLDTFLRPKMIRNMVVQKKGLDFENIIDSGKILLVKLSQGLIGNENSYLLGTIIVSKIYQAAMARQAKLKENRNDFFLYIDEFQNFICPSMSGILSGARKYHLGLILAHQDMQQLQKNDSELASSVISNAGTRICFRVGDIDAKKFEDGFTHFEAKDLQALSTGEAIARIDRPDNDFNLEIVPLPPPDIAIAETVKNTVISQSRKKYGTLKDEVEKSLLALHGLQEPEINEDNIVTPPKEPENIPLPKPTKVEPLTEVQETATKENLVKQHEQTQHRYLQTLIKRMAESRGYKALIEKPTPDGKGRVDVSLERNGKQIAIEISATTTDVWELHNIEKCLAAGYETVIACSNDKKTLEKIGKQVKEKLDAPSQAKVFMFEPEAFFLYLDKQVAQESNKEERIKGYRVKVEYNALPENEATQKRENIIRSVSDSMKKKNN